MSGRSRSRSQLPPEGDFFEFVFGLLIPLLVFMPAIIASALVIDLITEESSTRP